jgi:hypothetical protein
LGLAQFGKVGFQGKLGIDPGPRRHPGLLFRRSSRRRLFNGWRLFRLAPGKRGNQQNDDIDPAQTCNWFHVGFPAKKVAISRILKIHDLDVFC